jgi:hypothetical protein
VGTPADANPKRAAVDRFGEWSTTRPLSVESSRPTRDRVVVVETTYRLSAERVTGVVREVRGGDRETEPASRGASLPTSRSAVADDSPRSGTSYGVGDIGDPARFADSKALASYVGMIPREYSSGERQRLGGLSKQGNPLLRFLWGEAGPHAARKDPGLQRFYRRKLVQKGLGKASVAVARKLGIRLWIMLRDQIEYNEFCRRGQKQQKSSDACAGMPETRYGAKSHRPVD